MGYSSSVTDLPVENAELGEVFQRHFSGVCWPVRLALVRASVVHVPCPHHDRNLSLCAIIVASVPSLPRSVRVLIMRARRRKTFEKRGAGARASLVPRPLRYAHAISIQMRHLNFPRGAGALFPSPAHAHREEKYGWSRCRI